MMDKYSFREFLKSCRPFVLILIGIASGALAATGNHKNSIRTEKHGCEYVEKTECKQVWVRK